MPGMVLAHLNPVFNGESAIMKYDVKLDSVFWVLSMESCLAWLASSWGTTLADLQVNTGTF